MNLASVQPAASPGRVAAGSQLLPEKGAMWIGEVLREIAAVGALLLILLPVSWLVGKIGFNLTDETINFHFGSRVLQGQHAYRDFNYQVGPVAPYLDAAWQWLLGSTYAATLAAALAVRVAFALTIYAAARLTLTRAEAGAIALGLALLIPAVAHKSYGDAALASTLAAVALLALDRMKSAGSPYRLRIPLARIALGAVSGAGLGLLLATRQSNGVLTLLTLSMSVAGVLAVTFIVRRQSSGDKSRGVLTPPRGPHERGTGAIAGPVGLVTGLMFTLVAIAGGLAWVGALDEAACQIFLEAGEKKPYGRMQMALDGLSGGTWGMGWGSFFAAQVFPAGILLIAWRGRTAFPLLIAFAGGAVLSIFGRRDAEPWFWLVQDLPRLTLMLLLALGLGDVARRRPGAWITAAVAAIGLGDGFGMQVSWIGRDHVSQAMPAIALLLAIHRWGLSTALQVRGEVDRSAAAQGHPRRHVAGLRPVAAVMLWAALALASSVAFAQGEKSHPHVKATHPRLAGQLVPAEKSALLEALGRRLRPGDRAFIYGGAAPLYTLFGLENPTAVDMIYPDYVSTADGRSIARTLKADPPRWLIVTWGPSFIAPHSEKNPVDLPADCPPRAFGFNGHAVAEIHRAVHALLPQYELAFDASELETPSRWGGDGDRSTLLRLYRRVW